MAIQGNRGIRVQGIQDVERSLKKLGLAPKKSRTLINRALRPAGMILARVMQNEYKKEFNKNNYKRKEGRTPTWKTIGVVTARKSREPGLFVGPIKRKTSPIKVKGKDSYNLTEMQILGNAIQDPRPDIFLKSARKAESRVYMQAEKDLDKLLDKMIKQAGFK